MDGQPVEPAAVALNPGACIEHRVEHRVEHLVRHGDPFADPQPAARTT